MQSLIMRAVRLILDAVCNMSWRPWTQAASRIRTLRGNKRKPPVPLKKWDIVRGDLVEVLSGKDKGKQGQVAVVARKLNQVIVQGMNTYIRMMPASGDFPGGRMAAETPLHVSDVALVDPKDGQPTEVTYKYTEDGEKVRVAVRSGMVIPKPPSLKERKDFKSRSGYAEGPQDTKADYVIERTYVPSLLTFEEEISKSFTEAKLEAKST